MKKQIIFSDLHVEDYETHNIYPHSRLEETLAIIPQVFQLANKHDADICFSGDLIDKAEHLKINVLYGLYNAFKSCFRVYPDTKFFAIHGNHDITDRTEIQTNPPSIISVLSDIFSNFFDLGHQLKFTYKNCKLNIMGVPYCDNRELFLQRLKILDSFLIDGVNILLTHQNDPSMNPHIFSEDFTQYTRVFNGHIHQYNTFGNLITVGNPIHKDITDEGKDKFVLLYDPTTDYYETIKLNYTPIVRKTFVKKVTEGVKLVDFNIDLTTVTTQDLSHLFSLYTTQEALSDEVTEIGKNLIKLPTDDKL